MEQLKARQLIEKGVLSSTHLLSLMYAGELCAWHLEFLPCNYQQGADDSRSHSTQDVNELHPEVERSTYMQTALTMFPTRDNPTTSVGKLCFTCQERKIKVFACSQCHAVEYCSRGCQRQDWPDHKQACSITARTTHLQQISGIRLFGRECLSLYLQVISAHHELKHGWKTDRASDLFEVLSLVNQDIPIT